MAIMDRVRRGQHDLDGLPPDVRQLVTAALDPEPHQRPTLTEILGWLRPQVSRDVLLASQPPVEASDPYTVPIALAAQVADDVTEREIPQGAPTTPLPPDGPTEVYGEATSATYGESRPTLGERLRRATLLIGLALTAGAGCAAYPWLASGLLLIVVWLLRSGSLAASAHGLRRQSRGRKWWDGVQLLVATPWHLVQSIPGTVLLALWSLGLAVAAALVCYAIATGLQLALFVCGTVLAGALWLGPGGSRVQRPVQRAIRPLAASSRRWLVAILVVAAVGAALGARAQLKGADWAPADGRPHVEIAGHELDARGSMANMLQSAISLEIIIP
jgi:hypothetical protein